MNTQLLLLLLIVTYFMKSAGQVLFLMEGTMGNLKKHVWRKHEKLSAQSFHILLTDFNSNSYSDFRFSLFILECVDIRDLDNLATVVLLMLESISDE